MWIQKFNPVSATRSLPFKNCCSMNMYLFEHMVIQFYAGFSSKIGNNVNVISSLNVVTFVPETKIKGILNNLWGNTIKWEK